MNPSRSGWNGWLAWVHPSKPPEPCEHEWEYLEREPGETYTGFCERCVKCGEIIQVVQ